MTLLPGGVNSPVRAFKSVGGQPIIFDHVSGPYCFDVDGNKVWYRHAGSVSPALLWGGLAASSRWLCACQALSLGHHLLGKPCTGFIYPAAPDRISHSGRHGAQESCVGCGAVHRLCGQLGPGYRRPCAPGGVRGAEGADIQGVDLASACRHPCMFWHRACGQEHVRKTFTRSGMIHGVSVAPRSAPSSGLRYSYL